ncbi:10899_t:CDS:2, partial [Dentiscutata erythropus]
LEGQQKYKATIKRSSTIELARATNKLSQKELEAQIQEAKNKIQDLEAQIQESKNKYSVLQKELAKLQPEKVENEEEIKRLKIEINETIAARNQVGGNLLLTINKLRKKKKCEKNRKIDKN